LGDICEFMKKKNKYKASDGKNKGLYKFYTSSQDKILFRDDYEFENKYLLLGRGGNPSIHIASKFSVSHDDVYVIKIDNYINYIYYYIINNLNILIELFKGSTIKHSNKTNLEKLKIKIPKDKSLITALEPLFNEVDELEELIENDEKLFKEYLEELAKDAIISNDAPKITNYEIDEVEEVDEKQSIEKELSEMTIQELKNKCKELNIKGYSKLKKEELIEAIHK
jgi:restriction endonuclease S subunit